MVVEPTWDGILIAGAAVIAAGLAALTANHRMGKQLDAESKRLDQQLDAESERIERQLSHDREMQDHSQMRETLDEGAILIGRAWTTLRALRREAEPEDGSVLDEPAEREKARLATLDEATGIFEEFTGTGDGCCCDLG